ncbi:MAG: hypothetical protein H8K04_02705 [Nitrospira sp.]
MPKRLLWCFIWFLTADCSAQDIGAQFFAEGFESRIERLEKYPLDQQYKIFLYGNQIVHPPLTGLALPRAKRGQPALEFILEKLDHSRNDLDFRDSLVVFQHMQWGGYYNICGDTVAMNKIKANEDKIRNADWRGVYNQMLKGLCR